MSTAYQNWMLCISIGTIQTMIKNYEFLDKGSREFHDCLNSQFFDTFFLTVHNRLTYTKFSLVYKEEMCMKKYEINIE